jgi:hypothetical protein
MWISLSQKLLLPLQRKKSVTTLYPQSDLREVNKQIVRKPFPLPKISTVLQEIEGFTFATALDLNMGYYHIRLDPDSQKICTIIFPGKILLPEVTNGCCMCPRHIPS